DLQLELWVRWPRLASRASFRRGPGPPVSLAPQLRLLAASLGGAPQPGTRSGAAAGRGARARRAAAAGPAPRHELLVLPGVDGAGLRPRVGTGRAGPG